MVDVGLVVCSGTVLGATVFVVEVGRGLLDAWVLCFTK